MKTLFSLACILLIVTLSQAQYNPEHWIVDDMTTNTEVLSHLDSCNFDNGMWGPMIIHTQDYSHLWLGDVFKLDFNNSKYPVQNETVLFNFLIWEGPTGVPFKKDFNSIDQDHDVARGWTIDFTAEDNRLVIFKVQANSSMHVSMYLVDIAGKVSNVEVPSYFVSKTKGDVDIADDAKWEELVFSWGGDGTAHAFVSRMADSLSTEWHGISNIGEVGVDEVIDLSASQIAGVKFVIDQGEMGALGESKTLYIKDLVIGAAADYYYTPYFNCGNSIELLDLLSYNQLPNSLDFKELPMQSSLSIIDMQGRIVLATQINQGDCVNIESLNSGVYVLQVENDFGIMSQKIVK